ncbi:MAG: lipoate--protein ligase [Ruminococcaceae bacterium]|nr:lipoate--protein ligase [Oscillospiraceae bacterium]
MITKLYCVRGTGSDPYANLALEERLLDTLEPGQCILYLWQNENTVVIGRNQNAWKECRTALLCEEGGRLARRLSGGGAVFHDLGNLNFTFLMAEEDYDLDRQLAVIETACRSLGIPVARSGRNDVLADGRKFSGNAFYHHRGRAYHHGTLMVAVDGDKLGRYLSPSKAKLQAKGVDSVRSRVVNLSEFCPGLTCRELADRLEGAFGLTYGLAVERMEAPDAADLRAKYASDEWLYGPRLPLSLECEQRFDWGEVQIQLQVESGAVAAAKVYSDAMDADFAPALERALTGSVFSRAALCARVEELGQYAPDLRSMLGQLDI